MVRQEDGGANVLRYSRRERRRKRPHAQGADADPDARPLGQVEAVPGGLPQAVGVVGAVKGIAGAHPRDRNDRQAVSDGQLQVAQALPLDLVAIAKRRPGLADSPGRHDQLFAAPHRCRDRLRISRHQLHALGEAADDRDAKHHVVGDGVRPLPVFGEQQRLQHDQIACPGLAVKADDQRGTGTVEDVFQSLETVVVAPVRPGPHLEAVVPAHHLPVAGPGDVPGGCRQGHCPAS